MKKCLAGLSIVAVLFLGIVGALAVIPHTHGHDVDHSKHQSCPVYQFGIQNTHAAVDDAVVFSFVFVFCFILFTECQKFSGASVLFSRLRAPAALLS